jgi:hypothetical protein
MIKSRAMLVRTLPIAKDAEEVYSIAAQKCRKTEV